MIYRDLINIRTDPPLYTEYLEEEEEEEEEREEATDLFILQLEVLLALAVLCTERASTGVGNWSNHF